MKRVVFLWTSFGRIRLLCVDENRPQGSGGWYLTYSYPANKHSYVEAKYVK